MCAGTLSCRRLRRDLSLPLDPALLREVDFFSLAATQQYGFDLAVQKLPRLGITRVEAIMIDQKRLVL